MAKYDIHPNMHAHFCETCIFVWVHSDGANDLERTLATQKQYTQAHSCSKCGQPQIQKLDLDDFPLEEVEQLLQEQAEEEEYDEQNYHY
ncbi:MAG: hypothetical protein ACREQ5_14685 [Candidatus Dormibacteria bacterium]